MTTRKIVSKDIETPLIEKDVEMNPSTTWKKHPDLETINADSCTMFNSTLGFGCLLGILMQFLWFYTNGSLAIWLKKGFAYAISNVNDRTITNPPSVPFVVFFISQNWVLVACFLPPLVTVVVQKYRMWKTKKSSTFAPIIRSNMECFLECIRFQGGLLFGSSFLIGLLNTYYITQHESIVVLLTLSAVYFVLVLFVSCLFMTVINQTCAYVSGIEIIVHCEKDEEARD